MIKVIRGIHKSPAFLRVMLKKIIYKGEGEDVDFKQTVTAPHKIAKTIASFANTKGGKILVGVKDDKTIVGVDPEEEKYILETAADFYCDPPVRIQFEEIEDEEEDRIVLVVIIEESKDKPHFIKNKHEKRIVYIRQHDRCLPASKIMIDLMRKGSLPSGATATLLHPNHNQTKLLSYLEKHKKITLKQFMQIVNISKRRASRMLYELTLKGIIREHDHEKDIYYTL